MSKSTKRYVKVLGGNDTCKHLKLFYNFVKEKEELFGFDFDNNESSLDTDGYLPRAKVSSLMLPFFI